MYKSAPGRLTGLMILVAALTLMTLTGPATAQTRATVHELRQAGWVIVEKTENDEWHTGIPPYEELRRLVYVVTYVLEKEGKIMTCSLARDVMYDSFRQTCNRTR